MRVSNAPEWAATISKTIMVSTAPFSPSSLRYQNLAEIYFGAFGFVLQVDARPATCYRITYAKKGNSGAELSWSAAGGALSPSLRAHSTRQYWQSTGPTADQEQRG